MQSEKLQVRNDELQSEMKKITVSQVSSVFHTYVSSYVYAYLTFYMCVLCVCFVLVLWDPMFPCRAMPVSYREKLIC